MSPEDDWDVDDWWLFLMRKMIEIVMQRDSYHHGNNHHDVAGCATYCLNVFQKNLSA